MNVLIIGKFRKYDFGKHISENFVALGHQTFEFRVGVNYHSKLKFFSKWNNIRYSIHSEVISKIQRFKNKETKKIIEIVKQSKPDLIVSTHDYLYPDEINKIKSLSNAQVVLWFPDALSNIKKGLFFTAGYDFMFFVDKYIVETLRNELGLNTYFLPQACYPKFHHIISEKVEDETYKCDITNAGNSYPSRIALYEKLKDFDFKMWGAPPPVWMKNKFINSIHQNKEVYGEEKIKAFSGAKIVLNNLHPAVINGVNKRTFEIPACGGFQITKFSDVIGGLFAEGEEIVTYNNFEDLQEKIQYYLENSQEREKIAKAGFIRANKDHTYEVRLKQMIKIIFG